MTEEITQLTPEQQSLIRVYRKKWKEIAYSTEPIDREEAALAVKSAYAMIGKKEPKIIFLDSPFSAFSNMASRFVKAVDLDNNLDLSQEILVNKLWEQMIKSYCETINDFWCVLEKELWGFRLDPRNEYIKKRREQIYWRSKLWKELTKNLYMPLRYILEYLFVDRLGMIIFNGTDHFLMEIFKEYLDSEIKKKFKQQGVILEHEFLYDSSLLYGVVCGLLHNHVYNAFLSISIFNSWISRAAFVDFCVSVLNLPVNQKKWSLFESLVKQCNWMFPLENICFVCDRPRILSFDNQNRLHAEGCPAIQFADGFSVYAHHGVRLPEAYGKIPPNQWHSEWILSEKNAELRRLLIENIGYDRICQELQATELDNWQEYSLLKIDFHVDVESMYLLKMTCPSTGHIHALRVPPNMKSAKEAITWVNWGISPEEFSVQT